MGDAEADIFDDAMVLPVSQQQIDRFRTHELWREWSERCPELFDADDVRLAKSQSGHGYHFFEWAAALAIYDLTGYLSLIEGYEFASHPRKRKVLVDVIPVEARDAIQAITDQKGVQCPDLLCFHPASRDWFFCEVKGPKDRLRGEQVKAFSSLAMASGKRIKLVQFELVKW